MVDVLTRELLETWTLQTCFHHTCLTCLSAASQVRTLRMHLFTVVQLTCLSLLWVVMATAAALAFPFVLLLTIPVRMLLLPHLFTRRELQSVSHTLFHLSFYL